MEKKMENEMETELGLGLIVVYLGIPSSSLETG